jgi:hypothetical protein
MGIKSPVFSKSKKSSKMDTKPVETPLEAESRKDGDFAEVEDQMMNRYRLYEMGVLDKATGKYSERVPPCSC